MNPKTKKIRKVQCVVCQYPFSEMHHIYPKANGGQRTIALCPNHHHFANLLQIILVQIGGDTITVTQRRKMAVAYAEKNFDEGFNEKALDLLIEGYFDEGRKIGENRKAAFCRAADYEAGKPASSDFNFEGFLAKFRWK